MSARSLPRWIAWVFVCLTLWIPATSGACERHAQPTGFGSAWVASPVDIPVTQAMAGHPCCQPARPEPVPTCCAVPREISSADDSACGCQVAPVDEPTAEPAILAPVVADAALAILAPPRHFAIPNARPVRTGVLGPGLLSGSPPLLSADAPRAPPASTIR
ncbi:MAG: hypothetical protein SFX74_07070 [Fimbriimonadaceae bacterium]|nr:hypothetical protein [Fimbriimonadaceae bacterium]